uniref:Mannosyltransferase n=1 Tax=Branchiostoma floridae TaxID=7739 RepID=C3ZIY0_BRAFL|eukprot:XP_002591485.1 hypothetical protein BRAFLDRAFT_105257 [Branchiostoma floridae]
MCLLCDSCAGYHAPLDLYPELQRIVEDPTVHRMDPSREVNLCIGKEWYRFPNSFFLPENWQPQFIQSEFRGQLPKAYAAGEDGTKVVPTHMNDMNLEETSRYMDVRKCHYLVDLDLAGELPREPRYSRLTKDWTVVASQPFLDSARCGLFHPTTDVQSTSDAIKLKFRHVGIDLVMTFIFDCQDVLKT